jgi:polysaccharide export outer membrane protein
MRLMLAAVLQASLLALPAGAANQAATPRGNEWYPEYRIGPEDTLLISVWNNEALTRVVPVRPDGRISMPLLNDVQAGGLTPMELRDYLVKRLAEYMPNPELSVIVTEVRSFKVSVIGAVMQPGRHELKSWATVMDVLAMAGGFSEFASRSRVTVLRSDGRNTQRIPFDYDRAASGDGGQINFFLRPGDIVVVPGPQGVTRVQN